MGSYSEIEIAINKAAAAILIGGISKEIVNELENTIKRVKYGKKDKFTIPSDQEVHKFVTLILSKLDSYPNRQLQVYFATDGKIKTTYTELPKFRQRYLIACYQGAVKYEDVKDDIMTMANELCCKLNT